MIREHGFNSAWWGGKAGIVEQADFFGHSPEAIREALAPFEWAEFRNPLDAELPLARIRDAGFVFADTQVNFRVGLAGRPAQCAEPLSLEPASNGTWRADASEWAIFGQERFRLLPGITPARLNQRYARWAAELVHRAPETCFEIRSAGEPAGWYFAEPGRSGAINLTLGVLRRGSRISGYAMYEAALCRLAAMGYRIGWASFSIANSAVHNIYARLGARFVSPGGIWLWTRKP